MPEISAADLRRLRTRERQVEPAKAEAARAATEARRISAQLSKAEKLNAAETAKVDRLLDENKRMAELLAAAETARQAALAALEDRSKAEREAIDRARLAEDSVKLLEERVRRLEEEIAQAKAQAGSSETVADVVTGPRLAHLLDEFIGGIEKEASGLQLQGGSLRLQVGLADTGTGAAFVLPSASMPAERLGPLHEVTMSFDRGARATVSGE